MKYVYLNLIRDGNKLGNWRRSPPLRLNISRKDRKRSIREAIIFVDSIKSFAKGVQKLSQLKIMRRVVSLLRRRTQVELGIATDGRRGAGGEFAPILLSRE
jgi:hypothetical protein